MSDYPWLRKHRKDFMDRELPDSHRKLRERMNNERDVWAILRDSTDVIETLTPYQRQEVSRMIREAFEMGLFRSYEHCRALAMMDLMLSKFGDLPSSHSATEERK